MQHCKLSNEQVSQILAARLYGDPRPTYTDLARDYGVTAQTIRHICNRAARQDVPIPPPPAGFDDKQTD